MLDCFSHGIGGFTIAYRKLKILDRIAQAIFAAISVKLSKFRAIVNINRGDVEMSRPCSYFCHFQVTQLGAAHEKDVNKH